MPELPIGLQYDCSQHEIKFLLQWLKEQESKGDLSALESYALLQQYFELMSDVQEGKRAMFVVEVEETILRRFVFPAADENEALWAMEDIYTRDRNQFGKNIGKARKLRSINPYKPPS